jgi:hypothetical protein
MILLREYRNGLKSSILNRQIIAKARIPKFYSFNNWQSEVNRVISQKKRFSRWDKNREEFDKLFPCLAINDRITEDYIIYNHQDVLDVLRAILEVADKNSRLALDYTEQMHEGFYKEDEFIMADKPKSIILTEGSTDSFILRETLRALFPHFHEYFHFMDFDSTKSAGGAGALVNNLKAFIGSGITNHIIAIFDNDTAARDALRGLENIILPSNIRIMQLPLLKLARKYPTLGPQGNRLTNINGLACSIELYFGVDVLTDSTGTLIPVQWTGYVKNLRQYQGEITDKTRLQDRYLSKVRDTIDNPNHRKNYDWTGMNQVFQSIFSAFKRPVHSY